MKIAYIARSRFGALGDAAIYNYATYAARDNDVLVLAPDNPAESSNVVCDPAGVRVQDIFHQSSKRQVQNVFRALDTFSPDVIHMTQGPLCFHYAHYLRHLTPRAKWIMDFRSPHVGSRKAAALHKYFLLQFLVDAVLTHSLKSLRTNIRFRLRKAFEIPPGVSSDQYPARDVNQVSTTPKRFVLVTTVSKTRKVDEFVRPFIAFARNRQPDISLDVIGDGDALDALRDLVARNQAEKWVNLVGRKPHDEVINRLASYDVGVAYVPYEHFSSAPSQKSLEYAAAALPVVASDTQGHKDYVKRHGFDFNLFANSEPGIRNMLERVCAGKLDVSSMQKNLHSVREFDWGTIVEDRLFPVYRRVLGAG